MVSKMKNWLATYRKYKFLASLHFYKKTLSETAHLAYMMQMRNALYMRQFRAILGKLDEITREDIDLPFEASQSEDGQLLIHPEATNLPTTQHFKNTNQLLKKQRR